MLRIDPTTDKVTAFGDFGTIETSNIKSRLSHIAQAEGVEVDDEALELVARRAAGSMRDSQSIFDQLLAFGEEHISALDVHRLLGTASDDRLIDIGQELVERDKPKAIDSFHAALDGGVQLGELTDQLLFYLRDLMIMASEATSVGLLSVAPVSRKLLQKQAETWGLQTIVAAMQILSDTKGRMQRVTYERALAELALVRIAMLEDLTSISGLIDKLRSGEPISTIPPVASPPAAEKKNDVAGPAPTGSADEVATADVVAEIPAASVEQSLAPVETPMAAVSENVVSDASLGKNAVAELKELPVRIVSASSMAADLVGDAPEGVSEADENSGASSGEDAVEPTDSTSGGGLAEVATTLVDLPTNAASEMDEAPSCTTAVDEAPAVGDVTPQVADEPENDSTDASGAGPKIWFAPENSDEIWAIVVLEINDMLKSHVKSVSSTAIFAPNKLELTLPSKYHFGKTYLEKPEAQSRLQKIIARVTGVEPRITVVLGEVEANDQKAATSSNQHGGRQLQRVYKPEDDELVCSVVEIFDAQVVRINEISGGPGGK